MYILGVVFFLVFFLISLGVTQVFVTNSVFFLSHGQLITLFLLGLVEVRMV